VITEHRGGIRDTGKDNYKLFLEMGQELPSRTQLKCLGMVNIDEEKLSPTQDQLTTNNKPYQSRF